MRSDLNHSDKVREYDTNSVVIFHKTREQFGGLSNMASGFPLKVNGVEILTSEALYQACRYPHLPEVQKEIVGQFSPMVAKQKSKLYLMESRTDWNDVRHMVMRWCLRVKLAQNYQAFGELLLLTEKLPIVEFSNKDSFWGAVPTKNEEHTLRGENVLGRLLMELREKLRVDNENSLMEVPPLQIKDFLLFGRPVERVFAEDTRSDQKSLF
ncbi:NADAR family protein [Bacterioplanoides sp.]|uniref:NADAR family protein n=1 Tax=Bacterioplanoides sp. TaxID=2066072 RepID=UPI003B5A41EC